MSAGHAKGELLAQVRPGVTSALTLYTASKLATEITLIMASNSGAASVEITLFHDDDGTTYDATTQLLKLDSGVKAEPKIFQAQHPGSGIHVQPGGSLGVQLDTANDVTISVYGITADIAQRVRGL